MIGALAPYKQHLQPKRRFDGSFEWPEPRLLPVVADDLDEFHGVYGAVKGGVVGLVKQMIVEMGSKADDRRGRAKAMFLELIPGIRLEMLAANIEPSEMSDKLIAAAHRFHPCLIEGLDENVAKGDSASVPLREMKSPRERLRDRLRKTNKPKTPRLEKLGRIIACFVIYGVTVKEFAD